MCWKVLGTIIIKFNTFTNIILFITFNEVKISIFTIDIDIE